MRKYQIQDFIVEGSSACVYTCVDTNSKQKFIAKTFNPSNTDFEIEKEALQTMKHPSIIGYIDSYETEESKVLVLEKGTKDILTLIQEEGPFPVNGFSTKIRPIFEALEYIHDRGTIHCDVKPENIVVMNNGTFKLIDFGLTQNDKGKKGKKGTLPYIAPEIHMNGNISRHSDTWALGVTLFQICSGNFPFEGDAYAYMINSLCKEPDFSSFKNNNELIDLIKQMLNKDPSMRPSMKTCLAHPFFLM